jgi:putative transposase
MRRSRFSETQIVGILKEADSGVAVKDVCRKYGVSDATYYKWKSKYGGLEVSDVRRMRELEAENSQLKRLYANVSLENQALKDLISKKF